jgi:hypothetical protein
MSIVTDGQGGPIAVAVKKVEAPRMWISSQRRAAFGPAGPVPASEIASINVRAEVETALGAGRQ